MNTAATSFVVYPLDELGAALYRRLKAESDLLLAIRCQIRVKKKLLVAYTELWLEFEAEDLDDDADSVYLQKLKHEKELLSLERQEREQKEKVRLQCSRRS